ncbi:MAG: hypothetical protein CVT79_03300 [Alphaproteobacteria bacterium HGW-Alphaproteobacteria-18]|nr:MAG: hypothetical protein CVT79_03300 [Alphaproteobacteria bacterium HGW-Alphaproteobacteria-18]
MSRLPRNQAAQLQALVGIKRQKAEQDMLILQQDVRRIEDEIAQIEGSLKALDKTGEECDGASLARRHGAVERMIAELGTRKAALAARKIDLEAARDALRRVMHSQDRIEDL